jgi:glycosyltransferase involved in cell wall biosynthesis
MRELIKPYLLYVGNIYPHKNVERLVLAFQKLIKEKNADYQLVFVGGNIMDSSERIIFTGFVSDGELDSLYKNADLFVFPSLYEGFGFPPLEAMARGVAVASSRNACLSEVLGDAVAYFDPENIDDMGEKIYEIITNRALKDDLAAKGFTWVKRYNWEKTAEKTLEIYKNIPLD